MSLKPMTIQIPEDEIAALRLRLKQTRWPHPVGYSGWDAGTDADYLRALVDYWATGYHWREREARLNRFQHFIAEVNGTNIHFIRAGRGANGDHDAAAGWGDGARATRVGGAKLQRHTMDDYGTRRSFPGMGSAGGRRERPAGFLR